MTERFDGLSQQTTYGASGVGPAETVTSLTALGVGQGSGTTATAQEANSMIAFEFPIRWDDISENLSGLDDPRKLNRLIDDLTVRDNLLEDYLNTNIVSGIVAGSNITIDRATGIVTIATTATPIPSGTIMQYAGSTAPTGWLLCNGQLADRTTYAGLFAVIGTTYNIGSGGETSSNFRLPNLENRVPVGKGSGTFASLAATGGQETVTIATGNLPPHNHTIDHDHANPTVSGGSHQHGVPYGFYKTLNASDDLLAAPDGAGTLYYNTKSGDGGHSHTVDIANFTGNSGDGPGSSNAMTNLQPYLVLNYIIKP